MKRLLILLPLILACGPAFYQAPPPLARYPERIPTKTWREILNENQPIQLGVKDELTQEIREAIPQLATLPKPDQLKQVDAFITKNRNGKFNIPVANFLLELRELIELEIPGAEREAYLEWRSTQLPPQAAPMPPVKSWRMPEEEFQEKFRAHRLELFAFLTSYEKRIESASANLKPFEIVQQAGMFFRTGYLDLADLNFSKVIKENPKHPRAEIARFMLGRTRLQKLRQLKSSQFKTNNEFRRKKSTLTSETQEAFQDYLREHPKGRFVNDTFGWLGGIARDQGNSYEALNLQLQRLESQPTREVTSAVLRECDQIFAKAFLSTSHRNLGSPNSNRGYALYFDFDRLAKSPLISRLFVSHALDPAQRSLQAVPHIPFSQDRPFLDFLHRRIIAPAPAISSALSEFGRAVVKGQTSHNATSLLIVGWASARLGEHDQALSLFNLGLQKKITDELLHAKAVALSRLDRHFEASIFFQKLLSQFPNSPLSQASRFDLALSHLKSQSAGQAFLILHTEHLKKTRPLSPLHSRDEIAQWIDTILQFSPTSELRSTLNSLSPDHPSAPLLSKALALRALCAQNFEAAQELIAPQTWEKDLAPLINAHAKLKAATSPLEQARLHLEIGSYWKSKRGKITLPLRDLIKIAYDEPDHADRLRRENARFLGLSDEDIEFALSSRDELWHAFGHFFKASNLTTEASIAAPAIEKTNEALFRMAELSPYFATLASKNDRSKLSNLLVTRLKNEFANRPEAGRAIPFNFLPPALLGRWMPGDRLSWIADEEMAALFDRHHDQTEEQALELLKNLSLVALNPKELPAIRAGLTELDQAFQTLRPKLTPDTLITIAGHLDDLQLVANHPSVTADLFRKYLPIRLSGNLPDAPEESALTPFLEFLEFAQLPRAEAHAKWLDYLSRFPDGPKNEAISLRLLRTEIRESFPLPHIKPTFFPDAPRTTGYKTVKFTITSPEPQAAQTALREHRKKFPNGKYQADLSLLEAALQAAQKDYPAALANLTKILNDPNHPELAQDASLQFAELSLRLLQLEERAALASAFKKNPDAVLILKKLANGETCVSRIRPFLKSLDQ